MLQQLCGKVIQETEIKVEINGMPVEHLKSWISFVVSSFVKSLALDLAPAEFIYVKDRYLFPH